MALTNYLDAITQALREELQRDEKVFIIGEDVGVYGGAFKVTKGLLAEFGDKRIIDTPISEAAIAGVAAGTAITGMRPVAEIQFGDFITNAFNQIVTNIATLHYRYAIPVPLVIRTPSGGGIHGGPFHSKNPEAWFVKQPGLKVVAPAFPRDAKGLLKSAIRDNNPVIYFEHKFLYRRIKEDLPENEEIIVPLGKANIVREGTDVSIITYGSMVHTAVETANKLSEQGISLEVLDLRTLQPMDKEAIFATTGKTNRIVIAHEDTLTAGVGAEISAIISEEAFEMLDAPIKRVAAIDTPTPYAGAMEEYFLPNTQKLTKAVMDVLRF